MDCTSYTGSVKKQNLIMGKNCIREVLKASPERLVEIYTCQKPDDDLHRELELADVRIQTMSKHKLNEMVSSESHQSYVAKVKPRDNIELKAFLADSREKSVVLMLDSINDPQNLGSILRSAECFGVDLVVFSKNRGADMTPTVSKTSAGASELVPIAKISNLAEAIKAFQKAGYWAVTADVGAHCQELYAFDFPEKTLLIMGSEGKGVQPLIHKLCDFHITIPMHGQIDSLNVSQATAVMLSHINQR